MAIGDLEVTPEITIRADELSEAFVTSGGPGGQNVNKLATAVQLRFNVMASPALDERVQRVALRLAGRRATLAGEIVIEASRFRTRERNREDARQRLAELIAKAAEPPPKPRRKTRPTRASVERRLKEKVGRARTKRLRGKIERD